MKKAAIGMCLPVVLLAGCGGPTWKEYSPPDKSFHVSMYGTPQESSESLGGSPLHSVQSDVGGVTYIVQYVDLPAAEVAKIAKPADRDKFLTERAAILEEHNLKGKAVSGSQINVHGHAGREVLIDVPDQGFYRVRLFTVGGRYYQLLVKGSREQVTSEEATRFLNSFRLG